LDRGALWVFYGYGKGGYLLVGSGIGGLWSGNVTERRELSEADLRLINGRESGTINSGMIGTT